LILLKKSKLLDHPRLDRPASAWACRIGYYGFVQPCLGGTISLDLGARWRVGQANHHLWTCRTWRFLARKVARDDRFAGRSRPCATFPQCACPDGLRPTLPKKERSIPRVRVGLGDNRFALRSLALLPEVKKAKAIGLGEVPEFSNLQELFPAVDQPESAIPSKETWGVETLGCRVEKPNGDLSVWQGRNFGLKARCDGFTLFGLHLQNPTRGRGGGLRVRNLELAVLAETVAKEPGPVLVMGDFNTTPSALPFFKLLQTANLKRVSCGGLVAGTWRPIDWSGTTIDQLPGFKVTIDHILVRDLEVQACHVGPDIGSDHFPLIVTITQPN